MFQIVGSNPLFCYLLLLQKTMHFRFKILNFIESVLLSVSSSKLTLSFQNSWLYSKRMIFYCWSVGFILKKPIKVNQFWIWNERFFDVLLFCFKLLKEIYNSLSFKKMSNKGVFAAIPKNKLKFQIAWFQMEDWFFSVSSSKNPLLFQNTGLLAQTINNSYK